MKHLILIVFFNSSVLQCMSREQSEPLDTSLDIQINVKVSEAKRSFLAGLVSRIKKSIDEREKLLSVVKDPVLKASYDKLPCLKCDFVSTKGLAAIFSVPQNKVRECVKDLEQIPLKCCSTAYCERKYFSQESASYREDECEDRDDANLQCVFFSDKPVFECFCFDKHDSGKKAYLRVIISQEKRFFLGVLARLFRCNDVYYDTRSTCGLMYVFCGDKTRIEQCKEMLQRDLDLEVMSHEIEPGYESIGLTDVPVFFESSWYMQECLRRNEQERKRKSDLKSRQLAENDRYGCVGGMVSKQLCFPQKNFVADDDETFVSPISRQSSHSESGLKRSHSSDNLMMLSDSSSSGDSTPLVSLSPSQDVAQEIKPLSGLKSTALVVVSQKATSFMRKTPNSLTVVTPKPDLKQKDKPWLLDTHN